MWADQAIFYHIYPLGFCGAEAENDFCSPPRSRLAKISEWIPHLQGLGVNAVYLGPVWESGSHGYDTADYYHVDRRLGTDDDLRQLVAQLHAAGIKVVVDAVFNHVGRRFFAFRDMQEKKQQSAFCKWFYSDFSHDNHFGDDFCYQGWDGCDDLVRLNTANPEVRSYLYAVVGRWLRDFNIDGLRLDVAHYLNKGFLRGLHTFCREKKEDFWLMGEVLFGDYRRFANAEMLDSVTNYECYHGLHSSLNHRNMYELAYSLNRQYGEPEGLYRGLRLYNFADNHDVSRIATQLRDARQLKALYTLLFSMPGIPSLYYGSEWGLKGDRNLGDGEVRPCLELHEDADVTKHLRYLAEMRRCLPALTDGDYREVYLNHELLAFRRQTPQQTLVIAANIGDSWQTFSYDGRSWRLPPFGSEIFCLT